MTEHGPTLDGHYKGVTMIDKQRHYLSYLLRLWQEHATLRIWRASLENPQTGEREGFADMVQLFAFLEEQVADVTSRAGALPPESKEVNLAHEGEDRPNDDNVCRPKSNQ